MSHKQKNLYQLPDWNQISDSYFSYYDSTKSNQEKIQNKILLKKNKNISYEMSEATHNHAKQFFNEVGNSFKIKCKKGCAHCCYQPATVFGFEAIQIAKILHTTLSPTDLNALKDKMEARVSGLKNNSVKQNINNKTACPLLKDNQCSIYENRPMTCRMAHSFSVKKCEQAFQKDRAKVEIPVSLELVSAVSGIIEGVFEELPKKNLDGNLYELSSAVLTALNNPKAAELWAEGKKAFSKNASAMIPKTR